MPTKSPLRSLLPVTVLIIGGFAIGLATAIFLRDGAREAASIPGLLWPNPRAPEPFQLTDHFGAPFVADSLRGSWSFMFFGFTACPDACPTALTVLKNVLAEVAGGADQPSDPNTPRVFFVSVDPERDKPDSIAGYVQFFDPRFVGVTGTADELERFTRQLGVVYFKVPAEDNTDSYVIEHSTSILLFDPAGRLVALFSAPHDARDISSRFRLIRDFVDRHS